MAAPNDYILEVILRAKKDGMAAFTEMSAAMTKMAAEVKLVNEALDEVNFHGERHTALLQRISNYTRVTATEIANLAMKLESGLTPAMNNANTASTGAGNGFMGFLNAILPGGTTAAVLIPIIAGLALAFLPLTAVLADAIVLMTAFVAGLAVVGTTAAIAVGGILGLAAAFGALGLAQMNGLDPHQAMLDAQTKLTSAANQNSAAQEALAMAQTAVNQSAAVSPNQQLAVAAAHRAVASAALTNTQAQNQVKSAQISLTDAQARETQAADLLAEAQKRAADQTAKFGANSTQAIAANNALEAAQVRLQAAHDAVARAQIGVQNATDSVARANLTGQAAADGLSRAQNTVTSSGQATSTQQLRLKQAQEQAAESAANLAKAQGTYNKALADSNGPVGVFHEGLVAIGNELGKKSVPLVNQFAGYLVTLLPRIKDVGDALFKWFDARWPEIFKIAKEVIEDLIKVGEKLAPVFGKVIDYFLSHQDQFGFFFRILEKLGVDAIVGLLNNLLLLTDWFLKRLPELEPIAQQIFGAIGIAVQVLGGIFGAFVDWGIQNWPKLTKAAGEFIRDLGTGFNTLGDPIKNVTKDLQNMQPVLDFINQHGKEMHLMWQILGAAIITVFYIIEAIIIILLLLTALFMGLLQAIGGVSQVVMIAAKTAWPALSEAGKALWSAISTVVGVFGQLLGVGGEFVPSAKKSSDAIDDNRSAFQRFITSGFVEGTLVFFAVQLPEAILTFADWLKVAAIRLSETINEIGTIVKVGSDIARGDFVQAGIDMVNGRKTSEDLLKKDAAATYEALIQLEKSANGTITTEQAKFIADYEAAFSGLKNQVISTSAQQKHEQIQIAKEAADALVGKSIIPDMVNSVVQWVTTMQTSSTAQAALLLQNLNTYWSAIQTASASIWGNIHDTVIYWASTMAGTVGGIWGGMVTTGTKAGKDLYDAIHGGVKAAGNNLEHFIEAVDLVLQPVTGNPQTIPRIDVTKLAGGGVIPGYAPGQDTVPALLSPGEAVLTPQAVRQMGGPSVINTINSSSGVAHFAAGGYIPPLDGQCVPYVENALGIYWPVQFARELTAYVNSQTAKSGEAAVFTQGAGHVALVTGPGDGFSFPVTDSNWVAPLTIGSHIMNKSMYGFSGFIDTGHGPVAGMLGAVADLFGPIIDGLLASHKAEKGNMPGWIRDLPGPILDMLAAGAKDKFGALYNAFKQPFAGIAGAAVNLGGSVSSWVQQALSLTGKPASWLNDLLLLISKESSGNPNAVNPITVLGQHATGILQMLGSTFGAHMLPGHGNILNPIDNIASAIQYIAGRYGSPAGIPGLFGGSYVGYDSGGGLAPGLTVAYNGTGRTETVTTALSMDDVLQVLRSIDARLAQLAGQPRLSGQMATQRTG